MQARAEPSIIPLVNEEMMAERASAVDHTTIRSWTVRFEPLEHFNRRKRNVPGKWHVDKTYIKVRGQWMYLYRAIGSVGDTLEFWFNEQRDLPSAKRFESITGRAVPNPCSVIGLASDLSTLPFSRCNKSDARAWQLGFNGVGMLAGL